MATDNPQVLKNMLVNYYIFFFFYCIFPKEKQEHFSSVPTDLSQKVTQQNDDNEDDDKVCGGGEYGKLSFRAIVQFEQVKRRTHPLWIGSSIYWYAGWESFSMVGKWL